MENLEDVATEIFDSVVKIFVVSSAPNYYQPWQMQHQRHSSSSGFMIEGNYILCNAHGVAHARSVLVRRHGDFRKYNANILKIDHECDLALLQVTDLKFWENSKYLKFGDIPELQETVVAIGYPTGGDNISVTKGVVSRIGFVEYTHANSSLMAIQTDAAINSGNSGGPMMKGNKVIGVAFEHLNHAQNIGYAIPIMIVKHFLNDKPSKVMEFTNSQNQNASCNNNNNNNNNNSSSNLNNNNDNEDIKSTYEEFDILSIGSNDNNGNNNIYNIIPNKTIITQGFPKLGISWQPLENPSLKKSLNMDENTHQGIYIDEVYPLTGSHSELMEGDVLLSYDGIKIADDGTIEYKKNSRISFEYITIQKYVNDKANLSILRNGNKLNVTLNVEKIPRLVTKHNYDKQTKDLSYFIYGGFVFLPLSVPYLKSYYGNDWTKTCPIHLCHIALTSKKQYKDEEVVILTCVLADKINVGYHTYSQAVISKCNDIEIHNIAQLAKICDECDKQYIKFEIQRDSDKKICVLDTKVARENASQILNEHQIPHDRSFILRQYQKYGYPVFSFNSNMEENSPRIIIKNINTNKNENENENENESKNENINENINANINVKNTNINNDNNGNKMDDDNKLVKVN